MHLHEARKVHSTKQPLSEKTVQQLFVRMRAIWPTFGTTWKDDKFITAAVREWSYELAGWDENQLSVALRNAKERYTDFAPTLPQFKNCRKGNDGRTHLGPQHQKCLPGPTTPPEKVPGLIKEMLKKIKKPNKPNIDYEKLSADRDYKLMKMLHVTRSDFNIITRLEMLLGQV